MFLAPPTELDKGSRHLFGSAVVADKVSTRTLLYYKASRRILKRYYEGSIRIFEGY